MRFIKMKNERYLACVSSNSFGDQIIHVTYLNDGYEKVVAHEERSEGDWVEVTEDYLHDLIEKE